MRIVAGNWRGRQIDFPKDPACRPTMDRVREAVFSILQSTLENAQVLDLFTGSGAYALEALSRGAKSAVMVDIDTQIPQKNIQKLNQNNDISPENITLIKRSALNYLKTCTTSFTHIFLDPPWDQPDLFTQSLKAILASDILQPQAIIVCEYPKKLSLDLPEGFTWIKTYQYGKTGIGLIKKEELL